MANARNNMTNGDDVQITLRPDTYTKLLGLLKRSSISGHPLPDTIKVHCHIPVCIGYGQGTMSCENLSALVSDLQERGYDFSIYAAPRKKFDHEEEDPYIVWQRENAELLSRIGNKVILEGDWRKSDCWQQANEKYLSYKERNNETVERLLSDDVKKYLKRQTTKMPSGAANTLGQEEIKAHMVGCVVDCLSWMELETPSNLSSSLEKLNVLVYTHELTQLMKNAINSAGKIGYILGTLLHIEPKFEERLDLDNASQNSAVSPLQYAQNLSDDTGLSYAERQALSTIVTAGVTGGLDTLELGKVIAAMVIEFEGRRRQEEQGSELLPVIQAASAASSMSVPANYSVRNHQRHPSPNPSSVSVARGGMFAPVVAGVRGAVALPAPSSAATVSSSSSSVVLGSQGSTQAASFLRPTH